MNEFAVPFSFRLSLLRGDSGAGKRGEPAEGLGLLQPAVALPSRLRHPDLYLTLQE